MKVIVQNMRKIVRLGAFWIMVLAYSCCLGYMISDVFPKWLIVMSGREPFTSQLRGRDGLTERLKIAIVALSLLIDWIAVGHLLRKLPERFQFIRAEDVAAMVWPLPVFLLAL